MASVRKREWTHGGEKKTAWVVNYTDAGGKRRLKTFDRKKDADQYRTQVESDIEKGVHTPARESITVKAAAELFLKNAEHRLRDGQITRATYQNYKQGIDLHLIPCLGSIRMSDLHFSNIEKYNAFMRAKSLSQKTAFSYIVHFKQIEDFARKRGFTKLRSVADGCREFAPGAQIKVATFTLDDVRALIAHAGEHRRGKQDRVEQMTACFVNLAAFCGLRLGEIRGLTEASINLAAGLIHIRHSVTQWDELKGPKTRAGIRDVPMPQHVASMLEVWIEKHSVTNDRGLIFRTKNGGLVSNGSFHNHMWRPLLQDAGLYKEEDPFHFHALRHFAASLMLEMGLSLADTASLLGHSTFDTTLQIYVHPIVGGNHRREAADGMLDRVTLPATRMRQIVLTD